MRNFDVIEKMMKKHDIEFDVPFEIKNKVTNEERTLRLRCSGEGDDIEIFLEEAKPLLNGFCHWIEINMVDYYRTIYKLVFSDDIEFIQEPYKPAIKECYFSVLENGVIDCFTWYAGTKDKSYYLLGNCFRTEEEAKEHREEILKMFEGKPLVKWEDKE